MQIINVDLIPGKVMPILHASQFDVGRSLGVKLYNGGAVYDLTGAEVVSISVRKPDGNIVTETLTNAGGNELEIITTEQMTACAGASLCEIKIEDTGDVIGSANFVLEVEEDPLDGGIASQSEINNLATQVADLVSEQYDSANVIFDAVPTAGHGNGYTVTSEGIKDALDAINNPAASAVNYDNTDSGLTATNAQDAIDEVNDKADTNATNIGTLSSLTTTNKDSLVDAVNEVNGKVNCALITQNRLTSDYTLTSNTATRVFDDGTANLSAGNYIFEVTFPAIWSSASGVIHGGVRIDGTYTEASMIYGPQEVCGLINFKGTVNIASAGSHTIGSAIRTEAGKTVTIKSYVSATVTLWRV